MKIPNKESNTPKFSIEYQFDSPINGRMNQIIRIMKQLHMVRCTHYAYLNTNSKKSIQNIWIDTAWNEPESWTTYKRVAFINDFNASNRTNTFRSKMSRGKSIKTQTMRIRTIIESRNQFKNSHFITFVREQRPCELIRAKNGNDAEHKNNFIEPKDQLR